MGPGQPWAVPTRPGAGLAHRRTARVAGRAAAGVSRHPEPVEFDELGELARVAAWRRRGAPALRAAMQYADGRAESPWESLLRLLHQLCDVSVEPQCVIGAAGGSSAPTCASWAPAG